jgi:glutaconate CoA-transferase subunit A
MVQAGSMGVPYVPVRGFSGTDVIERRPDTFKIEANPFEKQETYVVAKAINPDIGIFHGLKADKFGNVVVRKGGDELMLAQSARKVIVTVEEIVDAIDPDDTDGWVIPSIHVTAVVHAPFGAYPTAAPGYYSADNDQLQEYVDAAQSEETFSSYIDKYVHTIASHEDFLKLMELAPAHELINA